MEKTLDEPQAQRPESRRIPRLTSSDRISKASSVVDLTDDNFDREVLDAKALVVIGFWSSGHHDKCQPALSVLRRLADVHMEIKVGQIDVTRSPEVVRAFDLKAVPHVAIVLRGDVVFEAVGTRTFEELEQVLIPFIEAAA